MNWTAFQSSRKEPEKLYKMKDFYRQKGAEQAAIFGKKGLFIAKILP